MEKTNERFWSVMGWLCIFFCIIILIVMPTYLSVDRHNDCLTSIAEKYCLDAGYSKGAPVYPNIIWTETIKEFLCINDSRLGEEQLFKFTDAEISRCKEHKR